MKLQIILADKITGSKGFLMAEIMMAFSLATLLITSAIILSTTMKELRLSAVRELEKTEYASLNLSSTTITTRSLYGNDTIATYLDPLTVLESDYSQAWGRDSCHPRLDLVENKVALARPHLGLGANNHSTDIEVRNGIAYITADSSLSSDHDFFIVDLTDADFPRIISSISTGPGLSALEIAGPYVYAANLGTTNHLQVIDVRDRANPIIRSRFKLPSPNASTTMPVATAIFYNKGFIYLGTEKWEGNEFLVIDVNNPESPQYVGGFETSTLINDIYVRDGIAYVAASDIKQMRILDVHVPASIFEISGFSPSGWETQVGQILSFFEDVISFGRTTGGFNQIANHEIFLFSTSSDSLISKDIPGGVYGIISRPIGIFLATRSSGKEFQVWSRDMSEKLLELSLGFSPTAMACDGRLIYFATGDDRGAAVLKIN